jgi:hypothetical protein
LAKKDMEARVEFYEEGKRRAKDEDKERANSTADEEGTGRLVTIRLGAK